MNPPGAGPFHRGYAAQRSFQATLGGFALIECGNICSPLLQCFVLEVKLKCRLFRRAESSGLRVITKAGVELFGEFAGLFWIEGDSLVEIVLSCLRCVHLHPLSCSVSCPWMPVRGVSDGRPATFGVVPRVICGGRHVLACTRIAGRASSSA